MPDWIVIPDWDKFQHYKNRDPVWIKNYVRLLQDPAYLGLTMHQSGVLHRLWLAYAASHRQITGGTLNVTRQVGGRVSAETLDALNHAGFIQFSASKPLAPRYQAASPEVEKSKSKRKDAASNGRPAYAELMAAARRYAADWQGGTSVAFDAGLDHLEETTGLRLESGDRYRLWDEALSKGGPDALRPV